MASLIIYSVLIYFSTSVNGFLGFKSKRPQLYKSSSTLSMSILSTTASIGTVASVIAIHEAGHLIAAKLQNMKVQSYNVGYGPKLFSLNDTSDTEYALRLIPLGGYVAFPSNVEYNTDGEITKELNDPDLLQNRPPLQRAFVISAGVIANFLLAWILSSGVAFTTGIAKPTFNNGVIVTTAPDISSPAATAGVLKGDIILKIDNQPIIGSETSVEKFVYKIRDSKDISLPLQIDRDGKIINLEVTPRSTGNKATIGLGIANNVKLLSAKPAHNIIEALQQGGEETIKITKTTAAGMKRFFTSDFSMEGVGGPISVIKAGSEIGDFSMTGLIGFACVLSINLALLNSLPIPALDGGQFVFAVLELIKGSALPRGAVDGFTRLGFSLMLALGVTTFVGDISKLGNKAILPAEIVDSMNAKTSNTGKANK